MDVPERIKCDLCGKDYAKSWIARHRRDAHGPGKEEKKATETAKKQEVRAAAVEILNHRDYRIPRGEEITEDEVTKFLEDVEFIDQTPPIEESEGGLRRMSISNDNNSRIESPTPKTKARKQPEQAIQEKMEKKLGFGHKRVPYGIIDILTDNELIEIKHWDGWITAIGQCIVYGHMYPNHMKHIHFFGDLPSVDKQNYIKVICAKLAISVTWEKPNGKQ